jgi:hypothetical protein
MSPNHSTRRSIARKSGAFGSAGLLAGGATTALLAAFAMPASATTLTVDSTGDGVADATHCTNGTVGDCTLRDALLAASAGDSITFDSAATGTIALTQGELGFSSAVSIVGPGASSLTVDGNGQSRVFEVSSSITGDVAISGLTITGGVLSSGNDDGAGIEMSHQGNVTLDGVVVSGNQAAGIAGGAVFSNIGNVSVTNSVISGNTAATAAGLGFFNYSGTATLDSSTVEGNTATVTADGGFSVYGPNSFTMTNSTISGNSAATFAGGFSVAASSSSYIYNSTIANNTAGVGGGIVIPQSAQMKIVMSTISGNSSTDSAPVGNYVAAGGIAADRSSEVYLYGVILSGNTSVFMMAISDMGFANLGSTLGLVDTHHSVLGNITGMTLYSEANVYSTDPGLAALADNGGPTKTMALLSGSVAIDAGPNPVPSFTGNQFDQRGDGYARITGSSSDIGAFEFGSRPIPPTTTTTVPGGNPSTDPVAPAFTG